MIVYRNVYVSPDGSQTIAQGHPSRERAIESAAIVARSIVEWRLAYRLRIKRRA